MIAPWYLLIYVKMERVAARHGWCLTIHGSMVRDLDVVLIPWTDDAEPEEVVLDAIDKFIKGTDYYRESKKHRGKLHATEKPYGRKAYSVYVGISGYYLDISVMPRKIKEEQMNAKEDKGKALLKEAYQACQVGIMDNSLTKRILDYLAE